MRVRGRWLKIVAVLLVASLPALVGAYILARGGCSSTLAIPLFHGPLALVAIWAALSNAPSYLRWPCGFVALWVVCPLVGPIVAADSGPNYFRRLSMAWEAALHLALTFAILSVLRESGLRLRMPMDDPVHSTAKDRWHLAIRMLSASVAAAAVLAWTLRRVLASILAVGWPFPVQRSQLIVEMLIMGTSLAAIDMLACWTMLRAGNVRWRLVLLLLIEAAWQILIWHVAGGAGLHIGTRWSGGLFQAYVYDLCYLGPMLLALFLVRLGGYRWTASPSLSP